MLVILVIMYLIPLIMYLTNYLEGRVLSNMLFVINPLALFICSAYTAKRQRDFYIFPIICSSLFIPLVFTIYDISYLPIFFIYIIISLLGGVFGLWCNSNSEGAKAFKKAFGISAIIACIFIFSYLIVDIYTFQCSANICALPDLITFNNIELIIIVLLIALFAIYCFKKDKNKKKD